MSTALSTIPTGALPAHLTTPDAAAAIAAANAAAAGGIKIGGFPRISIAGGKFHEVEGGEKRTYMAPTAPGQPAIPLMCLEAVIVAANPAITKTYYPGKFKDGDDSEPACSSDNGLTPDSHIASPQHTACATCPQNQWGSKISESSGKEIKACSDSKRLVIIPAGDLGYEALALSVTASALKEWGAYAKALTAKGVPINGVVTNITFDANASYPKLMFSFGRFLNEAEYAQVLARVKGEDVQNIVSPTRADATPRIAPPAAAAPAPAPAPQPAPAPVAEPVQPAATAGFGGTVAAQPAAAPAAEPEAPKPARKPRTKKDDAPAVDSRIAHLDAAMQTAVTAVGIDSPAGQAILAQFPAPAVTPAPAAAPPATAPQPAPVAPAPQAQPTPAPAAGFGGGAAATAAPQAPVSGNAAAASLAERLKAKLANRTA